MKFVFFGTPDVAKDTLARLYEAGFVPEAVVTNPDAPRGRGHVMTPSETKAWALEHNIPVLTPEKLDEEAIAEITKVGADYAIVVAYGRILPERLIGAFPKGVINVHYSLLPKYRGASPVESALLAGETKTGITLQKMVKELDAGDIIAQKEADIDSKDTTVTLRERLIKDGAELLINTMPQYLSGEITPTPQDHSAATFAKKLKKEDGLVTLDDEATVNWNKFRAYAAWPGTYFFENGKRIKITAAHMVEDGNFVIDRVIPEGKKEMEYKGML